MVKVTVISLVFNQEKFVRQTLEGFVMQKTDFAFEVLVHDDASTDKTVAIIREFADKYPDIIKPVLETENQYSKGTYEFVNDLMRAAKGGYIAYCEGDDYWTDDSKLQRQVDFLDSHNDYAICFHPVQVVFENGGQAPYLFPDPSDKTRYTVRALLKSNFIQTNSVMYRKQNYDDLPDKILPQDWYMHLYHAHFGKIGFIDRTMAVYRRQAGGIWWEAAGNIAVVWNKFGLQHLALYKALLGLYGSNATYKDIILANVGSLFDALENIDVKVKQALLKQAAEDVPEAFEHYIEQLKSRLTAQEKAVAALGQRSASLEEQLHGKDEQLHLKDLKMDALLNSRSWKATRPLRSISNVSGRIRRPGKRAPKP